MANGLPELPPGFMLDSGPQDSALPELPPGFILDSQEQPTATEVGPTGLSKLAGEQGFFQTGAIATGRGLFKIGRALGLVDPETELEKIAFEKLEEAQPVTTAVGEAVGEALPFAAAPVGAIASAPARIATTAALGAAEGGLIRRGEGATESEQLGGAGIGGAIAGTAEAILPVAFRLGSRLVRKLTGRAPKSTLLTPDGLPTEELEAVLDAQGVTFDDLTEAAQELLAKQKPDVVPEQAARESILKGAGLEGPAAPTTAQITRDPTTFQAQQELVKKSGVVRTRLESQQGVLVNKFDEAVAGTSGQPVTSGSSVFDHIQNKATELDNEISELYEIARERAAGGNIIDLSKTIDSLKSMRASDKVMGNPITALEGEAKRLGIIDAETGEVVKTTVENAELLRKFSNQLFNSVSDFGRSGLRRFRNSVDDDVTMSAGHDVFAEGRMAKANFEKNLSRSKINKFDKRGVSLVRDILDNKVDPDRLLDQTVLSKKYRADDIKKLKKYMTSGAQSAEGKAAFNDLRAEALSHIKNKSFVGPEDAAGNKNLSRAALSSVLDRIGSAKLDVLFSKEEIAFLKNMVSVSKLLEPPRGTALGKGPTAQAVSSAVASLKRRIDKLPVLSAFVDLELSPSGAVLRGKPAIKELPLLKREVSVAPTLGAVAVPALLPQEE